jgi:hypothetical protein
MRQLIRVIAATLLLFFTVHCADAPEPRIEIEGDQSWFQQNSPTPQDTADLFALGATPGVTQIVWPRDERRVIHDISLDLSGSHFWTDVRYGGETVPLAEYNAQRIIEHIRSSASIQPGDLLILRTFGEVSNSSEAAGRERYEIQTPRFQVGLNVDPRVRANVVRLEVRTVSSVEGWRSRAVDSLAVLMRRLLDGTPSQRDSRFLTSPLPDHVRRVIREHRTIPAAKRHLYFVTDGWFQVASFDFRPNTFQQDTVITSRIKQHLVANDLKPSIPDSMNAQVVFWGVNGSGIGMVETEFEALLQWLTGEDQTTVFFF